MTNNTVSEKHDLFATNAERRANNVLRALDVFQKCFDTQTYDYNHVSTTIHDVLRSPYTPRFEKKDLKNKKMDVKKWYEWYGA